MGPVGKTLIGGIATVAIVYILLAYSGNLSKEAGSATQAFAAFAKTARGE